MKMDAAVFPDIDALSRAAGDRLRRNGHVTVLFFPGGVAHSFIEEAHAIQDAVSHQLGQLIAGFKAMAPANGEPTRGMIYGGNIHASVGKASFEAPKLVDNINMFLSTIIRAKPATAKGQFVKSVTISSTMGPSVKVDPAEAIKAHG